MPKKTDYEHVAEELLEKMKAGKAKGVTPTPYTFAPLPDPGTYKSVRDRLQDPSRRKRMTAEEKALKAVVTDEVAEKVNGYGIF
jgi:hypothetical protein